jgi:hypothetical protein
MLETASPHIFFSLIFFSSPIIFLVLQQLSILPFFAPIRADSPFSTQKSP